MRHWLLIFGALAIGAVTGSSTIADEPLPSNGRQVAGLRLAGGVEAVAHIETPTRIQYFVGQGDKWKPVPVALSAPRLVPGAPLALVAIKGEELPQVLTIDAAGRFVEVTPRKTGPELAPVSESFAPVDIAFPPGGDFAVARRGKRSWLFAVDRTGSLREFDSASTVPPPVESRADLLIPGSVIGTLPDEGDELFLSDRRGNLVSYIRDPVVRWKGPRLIGADFLAGGNLAVWRRPDNQRELQIAAVNRLGELHVGRLESGGWRFEIAPGWLFPPGCPVGVAHTPVNMRFCAVNGRGVLHELHRENTEWRDRSIAGGFAARSSALFLPAGPMLRGIDAAGNLITSAHSEEVWTTHVTAPDPARETARFVDRTWKRAAPRDPPPVAPEASPKVPAGSPEVTVAALANVSSEELLVRLYDRRSPGSPQEIRIAAGEVATIRLDRDTTGELIDLWRHTLPDGTKTEQPRSAPTSPQSLYDIEVLVLREESVTYIDLRQKPWPPLTRRGKNPLTLGRFAIPTGNALPTGARIDLRKSAEAARLTFVGG